MKQNKKAMDMSWSMIGWIILSVIILIVVISILLKSSSPATGVIDALGNR